MIRKSIIIVLLLAVTLQQCQKGCLRCTASNTCAFCDVTNSYYQVNNTCALTTLTNCQVLTQAGLCTQCVQGYYLDQNTAKCLAVPTNNTIANCAAYSPAYACNGCGDGFYISNGACVQANVTVANCQRYSANGVCSLCASGYVQSLDTLTCVAASASNCLAYSFFACSACSSGYFYNQNLYFTSFVPSLDLNSVFGISRRATPQQLNVCQQVNVTNCAVILNAFTCQTCNTGYYLANGLCVQNPPPIIPNCATYSSLTTCTGCAVGYFLSSNACTAVVPIATCVTYSTTLSPTTCIACNSTSFVSNNACALRTKTITNCVTYNPLADQCMTCATNFMLTSDNLNCLAVIANCATYATWSVGQTAFSCQTCKDGYLITTANSINSCTAGTLTGCAQYTSATVCASCADGYWLNTSTNLCVKSVTSANCVKYDPKFRDSCLQCATGYVALTINQGCVPIATASLVANCAKYDESSLACTACNAGYYLNGSPAACSAIPAASSCVSMDSSQNCLKCATGQYPYTGASPKTCVPLFDYVSANCNTTNTADNTMNVVATNNFCSVCKTKNIPYATNFAEAICVKNADLAMIYGNANYAVSKCVRYGLNIPSGTAKAVLVCMECEPGFYITNYDTNHLASTNRTCGACATTGGAAVIIPDDFFGTVNICVAAGKLGLGTTQYGIRMARVKYNNNQVGDYQFTTADPTGILSVATLTMGYEAPPASTTTALTSSSDYYQGFTTTDTGITPSVFNYRGLPAVTVIQRPTSATPDWTTNCEITTTLTNTGSVFKNGGTAGGAPSNYWTVLTGNPSICLRCQLGYHLSFAAMNPGASSPYTPYPKCAAMTNAQCLNSVTVVGGLPTYLNGMISCFSCAANNFPWVYFEYSAYEEGAIRTNKFLNHLMTIDKTSYGFTCASASDVATTTATTAATLANCGVFGRLAANTDSSSKTVSGPNSFCLACAAGYVPTYFASAATGGASSGSYIPFYAVTACTASANCDTLTTNIAYNTCGRCSTASVSATPPIYYAYTDHTLSNCLPSLSSNCFLLKGTGLSTATTPGNACSVCVSGYFLNQDGVCELLTIPNIAQAATFSWAYYARQYVASASQTSGWDSVFARVHYLLSFQKQTYGASDCATGYSRGPASQYAPSLCVQSGYLNAGTLVASSKYIQSCTHYVAFSDNKLPDSTPYYKCAACSGTLALYSDYSGCVTALANCKIVDKTTPTKCSVCNAGYFNINGACSQPALPTNCAALANTASSMSSTQVNCGRCTSGMFLNTNQTCSPGPVLNCDQYASGSSTLCGTCLSGFILISLSSTLNYCFPNPVGTYNCNLRAATDTNVSGDCALDMTCLTCGTCNYVNNVATAWLKYTADNAPAPWTVCSPFNLITNCQTYNQAILLPGYKFSNFTCSLCNAGYYIGPTGYTCVKRVNMPAACATYNAFADVCTFCSAGYFLKTDGTDCIPFPIGVVNCAVYSAATTCSQCASGYYLAGGLCLQSTSINNCVTYSANYTCTACASGYMLVNATTCSQATAQNCATYSSLTACATCAFGYTLQTANSITSCNAIVIANCAILNPTNQNLCGYCNTGFYLNSAGACVGVTTTIANCLYYSGAAKCSNCTSPNVLSVDGSACYSNMTSLADANCANQFATAAPTCNFCSLGYMFSGGSCAACPLLSNGCQICDSSNTTNCLLCNTAYYMDSTGKCNANAPSNNASNNTTTTTPTSAGRFVASVSLALAVVMFGMG